MSRILIRPNQSYFRVDWRELWEYRDLLWFLVKRDFTAVYKQSILGPLWFIVQPLATTLVFTVIFGNIAKIGTDGMPPLLFYMSGMVLWNYFQGCMNGVGGSLIINADLFRKIYFPRLILPLSIVISNLGQLALNLLLLAGFLAYYVGFTSCSAHLSAWVAYLPILVLQAAVVGLGVGLWLSAMTVKYRDLRFALPFLAQLWMFATPIVYPASGVTKKWWWVIVSNPMSSIVEIGRRAFLGVGTTSGAFVITGAAMAVVVLVTGVLIFNRVQRTFVDTI